LGPTGAHAGSPPPSLFSGAWGRTLAKRVGHAPALSPFALLMHMEKLLGLPVLASEHGQRVDNLIIYLHWLMIALFVGWLAYFIYVLFRFHQSRHPKADYHGVRHHATTYIEGAVALVEVALLVGIAIPYWVHAVDRIPKESDATVVQVVAQQFAWNVRYPGKDGVFGRQDMRYVTSANVFGVDPNDAHGKDDVQTLTSCMCLWSKWRMGAISPSSYIFLPRTSFTPSRLSPCV
jgi:heme/copper-type cytochrome/quinol oxidase subunit 2